MRKQDGVTAHFDKIGVLACLVLHLIFNFNFGGKSNVSIKRQMG